MLNKLWMDIILHIAVIGGFLWLFMPQIFASNLMTTIGYILALAVTLKVAEVIVFKEHM